MTTHELKLYASLHSDFNKYWMPLTWFSNLASRAREEGRVRDDIALRLLMDVRSLHTVAVPHTDLIFCITAFVNMYHVFPSEGAE